MYLLSEKLIKEFIDIPRIEEQTLPDALKYIINNDNDKKFEAACYFSCNEFKDTIYCHDFYPPEIENLKTSINEHIKKLDLNLKGEIKDEEGLIICVAKKFVNKEYEKCYISINDVDHFKKDKTNELSRYFKDIPTGYKSEYFLPVYIKDKYPDGKEKRILHAVLVLFSNKDVTVTENQLENLSDILSVFITMKTTKDADKKLNQFVNELSGVIDVDNIVQKNNIVFKALRTLFVKNDEEENQQHSHLVYASLWSLNDNDPDDIFLEKEHALNFLDLPTQTESTPYVVNCKKIQGRKQHYFYRYIAIINRLKKKKGKEFSRFIKPKFLSSLDDQFTNFDIFLETQQLRSSDILVLVPIFPFDKNKLKYVGLLSLYFDEKSYSYYYNSNFLETVSREIFLSRYIVIQNMRRKLRGKLIRETGSIIEKEKEYYKKVCDIIRDSIKCKECLIYLYENATTLSKVVEEERLLIFPAKICTTNLPSKFQYFSSWLNDFKISLEERGAEIPPFIYSRKDLIHKSEDRIYSLMVLPIVINRNEIAGFIVLVNKIKKIDGENKGSSFLYCHFEIASIAEDIISLFIQIFRQHKISDGTLSKLNHELPAQTEVIIQNAKSIGEELKVQAIRNRAHINNLVYRISGAASIIRQYSQYTKMKNFDEETANSAKEALDLKTFVRSMQDIFRTDARKRGVNVKFVFSDDSKHENTIYVHQQFQSAIINLINNAIQYAAFGTIVIVKMISTSDEYKIIVENMGISIPDEDRNRIWEENFRGKKAAEKYLTGTGFGLSLVQRIVGAHGGTVIPDADNDLFDYNIFGIIGLQKILKEIKSNEKKMIELNCLTEEGRKDYEMLSCPISLETLEKYKKYSDFRFRDNELIKEFIAYRKENNILFEEMATLYLKEPVSHIKFTVSMKK